MATSSELRMSVSMVVTQCEDTLKTHLDVEAVTRLMLSDDQCETILGKTTKKYLEKSPKKGIKFLLAVLKKLELPGFVLLLESLERIGDEKHLTALTTIATHIEYLTLPTSSDKLLTEAIDKLKRIRDTHFKLSEHPDVPVDPDSMSEDLQTPTLDVPTTVPGDSVQPTVIQIVEIKSTTISAPQVPSIQQVPQYPSVHEVTESSQVLDNEELQIHTSGAFTRKSTTMQVAEAQSPIDQLTKTLSTTMQVAESQLTTITDSSSVSDAALDQCSDSQLGTTHEPEIVLVKKRGAMLYSPVHGITVTVPPTAVHSQNFELQMSASLKTSIPIDPEYVLCSAIVELTTNPKIDAFTDYITVSMPHCAVNIQNYPEFYCVISHTDGELSFKEDTSIQVDFESQQGYFSFKTKHFTRYGAACKRKRQQKAAAIPPRTQPIRSTKKSKSLEYHYKPAKVKTLRSLSDPHSKTSDLPDVRFCLGMFSPYDKKESLWKVVFLTCLDTVTGYKAMEQEALRLLRLPIDRVDLLDPGSQRIPFLFQEDCSIIEFSPAQCNINGWIINAIKTPAIICKKDVENHTIQPRDDTSYTPHGLIYVVCKHSEVDPAVSILCQQFRVSGILSCYGDQIISQDVSFTLIAELASSKMLQFAAESISCVFEELYHPSSKILGVIRGEIRPDEVELELDDPETIIFIAELSFCISSKWMTVAKHLMLHDFEIKNLGKSYPESQEAAFQVMLTWLQSSARPQITFQCLTDILKSNGIILHVRKLAKYVHSHKEELFRHLSRSTVAEIAKRIASQWKFIGRLLGMTKSDIDVAASQGGSGMGGHHALMEQAVAILDQWNRSNGYKATLLKLKNVIYAVHEHSGHELGDAVNFDLHAFSETV